MKRKMDKELIKKLGRGLITSAFIFAFGLFGFYVGYTASAPGVFTQEEINDYAAIALKVYDQGLNSLSELEINTVEVEEISLEEVKIISRDVNRGSMNFSYSNNKMSCTAVNNHTDRQRNTAFTALIIGAVVGFLVENLIQLLIEAISVTMKKQRNLISA